MAVKPYLQLVRLPNLFTAAADSLAGWLLVGGALDEPRRWLPLVFASVCTYAGGVVLNDVFDFEVDRVERPERPLPSGKVGRAPAAVAGAGLLAVGMALVVLASTRNGWLVESALIACILAYDAGLKRTAFGPEAMGACRGLNVLLGMSQAEQLGGPFAWLVAGSYAGFVTGITWISRSEVHSGLWKNIAGGIVLQDAAFLGLIVACLGRERFPDAGHRSPAEMIAGILFLLTLAGFVNHRSFMALRRPEPSGIQRAVRFAILSLVWLHVGLLLAVRGPVPAVAVGLLWLPAAFAGRWIYST